MFTFRELYEMVNGDHFFNKGFAVEVLKGFYQHIPAHRIDKKAYRTIRLSNYKFNK